MCYNGVNINYRGEYMELGEKILQARKKAGLSQRQLCGDVITRNMLSQIEHGTAKPSMDTLKYLASRLEKPVSYFLEEDLDTAPMETLAQLRQAEAAVSQGKHRYAAQLLERMDRSVPELNRMRLLLQARLPDADPEKICEALPSMDQELFLRARAAFSKGSWDRCLHLLEGMENRNTHGWYLLRGKLSLEQNQPEAAAEYLLRAEECREVFQLLERCYREMDDYKKAYYYAVKQK